MARALRPVLVCLVIALPAIALRLLGSSFTPALELVIFGAGVVAASFVLAWAAQAAEHDIAGGLAIAVLAAIAVLPEYVVDLYFAFRSGADPSYVQFAAANMTGSNRLLLGLGWSVVVLLSVSLAGRRTGRKVTAVLLDSGNRMELGFLAIASLLAFIVPATGQINLILGCALLGFFGYYLVRAARSGEAGHPDLVGPSARIGSLPRWHRRAVVITMFVAAATVILVCAKPFAEALVETGRVLGVDQFLLVQWLAPLASEAPEFIVAIIFASRGKAAAALGILISAKVNQWTLLIGSLPVAYLAGGGTGTLHLDGRQVEEMLLTACQTVLGVAVLLALRFPRWAAIALLALFAVPFAVPGTAGRLVISAVYLALALGALVFNRSHIVPTLAAPIRRAPKQQTELTVPADRVLEHHR